MAYAPAAVNAVLAAGLAPESEVDEHVRRILRTLFAYGFFDRDAYPYDNDLIDKQGHADAAQQVAEAGIVLMKNDGVLPLESGEARSVAVIGAAADELPGGGGSSAVQPFFFSTAKAEIESRGAAAGMQVRYDTGEDQDQAAALAAASDVAVVFVADAASEGDRQAVHGPQLREHGDRDRDALIEQRALGQSTDRRGARDSGARAHAVAQRCRRLGRSLVSRRRRRARRVARVLFGDVNPSGRLPATFPGAKPTSRTPATPRPTPACSRR